MTRKIRGDRKQLEARESARREGESEMQQMRSEPQNGRQRSGGSRLAGVDTVRRPAAHAHGACREAVDWRLRHSEAGWLVRRPCALVHCTLSGRVTFDIPELASLMNYPGSPARDAMDEGVRLFESRGSGGHSQGQTAAECGKRAEDDGGSSDG